MTVEIRVDRLSVQGFRNIEQLDVRPAPRVNVVSGDNGQGKTSLLEALYAVATSRSFRTERLAEAVRESVDRARVRATVVEDGIEREQRAEITRRERAYLLDGKRPESLRLYATRTPVVVFHPGDIDLVTGPASLRRKLLDRVGLFLIPDSADHRARYERAARSRLLTLERRGVGAPELDALERLMAVHGAAMTVSRGETVQRLSIALSTVFPRIIASQIELTVRYVPGATTDAPRFASELRDRRDTDWRRRRGGYGPQRDDLDLTLDGRSVRHHASQGQQRLAALALKIAELHAVRDARGAHPVLLLDDVSSELDPTRTGAVYDYLRETPSQVFVTTTRPELFTTPGVAKADRADWVLSGGKLVTGDPLST